MGDVIPALPDKIKMRAIRDLVPYATNSRTHSEAQIAQIAESMQEFGFTNPVLVSADSVIIAGHGRILAADWLGMTEVPTVELGHLTPTQLKAYVIADNQVALNAGWDFEILKDEIIILESEFNVNLLGFDDGFMADLLGETEYGKQNRELNMDFFADEMELKFRFSSNDYHAVREKLLEHDESLETSLLKALALSPEADE